MRANRAPIMSASQPAPASFRANRLRQAWQAGRATLNGWLAIPEASSAEAMAHAGWDSLTIDMQHGLIGYQRALSLLIAISTTDTVPLVRVPWLEDGLIMKMLDAGAYGIICPMINSREEAQRFASACRYPLRGHRSSGPIRAALFGGPDYFDRANDTVLAIAMIETREAMDHLEEILQVEELDAVYVGPSDLSLSHGGRPGFDQEDPPVVQAIERIIRTAKASGKRVGVHNATVAYAMRMIALGADFVTVGSDMRLMMAGAQKVVADFRAASGPQA
jgi:4-hydroxy-2-oxoheptanedioate aldolase